MASKKKSNVVLFGEQTSAYFFANYIWSIFIVVFAVLAAALFLKIFGIVPDEAKSGIAQSIKTIIGGPSSFDDLERYGYLLICVAALPVSWILYIRVRAKYIRDLALYETMRSLNSTDEPDVADGMFYRTISSRSYRIAELMYSVISIFLVVGLLGILIFHFLIPPRLQVVELVHSEGEGYYLRWQPSFRARCSYVEVYDEESEWWMQVESGCPEHYFDSSFHGLDEVSLFNDGIYDISYEYEDENIKRYKVTVKGVFFQSKGIEVTADDLKVLDK